MRYSQDFCDVTLVSEDKMRVEAHKVILASSSTFFKDMFKSLNHNHPLIYMRGVTLIQLRYLIQLIYFEEKKVQDDECEIILKLIEEFQLYGEKEVVKKKEADTISIMFNFWNKGYCKEGDGCPFDHTQDDCQEHLKSGRCGDPWCPHRHRYVCKHWKNEECPRGNLCEFLHNKRSDGNRSYERSRKYSDNSRGGYSSSSGEESSSEVDSS